MKGSSCVWTWLGALIRNHVIRRATGTMLCLALLVGGTGGCQGEEQPQKEKTKMVGKGGPTPVLPGRTITAIAFSPGGRRALTGDSAGGLALWDLDTGEEIRSWQACPEGTWRAVEDVAFLPDGNRAVSLGEDQRLAGWDIRTGKAFWTAKTGINSVPVMALSQDGKLVLTADGDLKDGVEYLRLWDSEIGTLKVEWKRLGSLGIRKLFFKPGGREVFGIENFRTLFIWDIKEGKVLQQMEGQTDADRFAFTSDGRFVLTERYADVIALRSLADWGTVWSRKVPPATAGALAVSPDGSLGLASSEKNKIEVLDLGTGRTLRVMEGPEGCNHILAFSPEGKRALSGGGSGKVESHRGGPPPEDRTLILWNLATGKAIRTLKLSRQTEMDQIEASGGKAFPR